jgi:DNA helicase-2/ATP-dependent DNA helicase PcrA
MYGKGVDAIPSRFVDELPGEHVDVQSDQGLYGAGRSQHWDSSGFGVSVRQANVSAERRVLSANGEVFTRGDRVYHEKFGTGTIIHIDGHKLDINFERGGQKRVMDSFVTKAD